KQDLLLPRAGGAHVHRRESTPFGDLPVELELRVTRALELLENHRVRHRAGFHQRGGDDGQRPTVFNVSGRAEEALGRVERGGVDTARHDAAAGRRRQVVRPSQPRHRVEQHHDVVSQLDEPLGALNRELRDGGVVLRRTVERRGDDLALDRPLHVRDLFWPLVDEHDHEVHFRVVAGDRVGDRLQHHRLTGLRRRDDQRSLPFADRHDEVDDPGGEDVRLSLQPQPLLRVERSQLVELRPVLSLFRVHPVDRVEADQRVVLVPPLLTLAGRAHRAGHRVAPPQAVLLHLRHGDVNVVRARQVAGGADERVVVQDVDDAGHGNEDVVLTHLWLTTVALASLTATPPTVPETAPPAASAAVLGLLFALGVALGALRALGAGALRRAALSALPARFGPLAVLLGGLPRLLDGGGGTASSRLPRTLLGFGAGLRLGGLFRFGGLSGGGLSGSRGSRLRLRGGPLPLGLVLGAHLGADLVPSRRGSGRHL